MKSLTFVLYFSLIPSFTFAEMPLTEIDSDESVLSIEGEDGVELLMQQFRFPQTVWPECTHTITGNYDSAVCLNTRGISSVLKQFMDSYVSACVEQSLPKNSGHVVDLHIVHAGILGDAQHSPRSLHAERRAIDIRNLQMLLSSGEKKQFIYADTKNRPFYQKFRQCWGEVIRRHARCPVVGKVAETGSIGWENANHRQHMHLSVPYCPNGNYSRDYYVK
jgi:hypothetical protein